MTGMEGVSFRRSDGGQNPTSFAVKGEVGWGAEMAAHWGQSQKATGAPKAFS